MSWWSKLFGRDEADTEIATPIRAVTMEPVAKAEGNRATASPMRSVGTGGTAIHGGYVQERERNADLTGSQKWITFDQFVLNLPIVGASARIYNGLLGLPEWSFEAADASGKAGEIAEAVEDMLDDLVTPWPQVVGSLGFFRYRGNSISEWTAKRRPDGLLGFRDVAARPQHTIARWDVAEDGEILGVWQRSPITQREVYLPRWKLAYAVDKALGDSPEGVGLLRHCVTAAKRLVRYEQLEGWGYETDLGGTPVCRVPLSVIDQDPGLSPQQKREKIQPFETIIANHLKAAQRGYVLDSETFRNLDGSPSSIPMYGIEILRGDGSAQGPIGAAISRIEHQIARILGTTFLLTGADGKGSLALSTNQLLVIAMLVDSALRDLRYVVRKDLIEPLGRLNGWPLELLPWPRTDRLQTRDPAELSAIIRDLAAAGIVFKPGDKAPNEVLGAAGLSEIEVSDDDILDASLLPDRGEDDPDEDDVDPDEPDDDDAADASDAKEAA